MVILIVITVVGALTPGVVTQISHARVNRAARIVAADLMAAQSMASRTRGPMRLLVDSGGKIIEVRDLKTNTVTYLRFFGTTSEFKLTRLAGNPGRIIFFPSGMASVSQVIAVGMPGYQRTVNVSRAGQIRVQ